jgi:hypothetical protein
MFNPPITDLHHASTEALLALLAVIKDPDTHKKRLDQLIAQEAATKEQIAALNEMAGETRRLHTEAAATTIVLNNRKTALDAREAELDERAKSLEQVESKRSDAAMRRRENLVASREQAALLEADRLAAMRTDLETRLEKIRNLAGSLT